MKFARIEDIEVTPNRQRQHLDPQGLTELRESIENRGLMHPIVLRAMPEGHPKPWRLVAGERRLRAVSEIWELGGALTWVMLVDGGDPTRPVHIQQPVIEGSIPFTTLGELTELEAEEAELDENIKRRDLTWQEAADAHSRLHRLRQAQAVEAARSDFLPDLAAAQKTHSVADTAKELFGRSDGAYHDTVRKELIVARHLDKPEIAGAKSLDEAMKILKQQEQRSKNIALAVEVGKTFTAESHTLLQADCCEIMGRLPTKFDVILTDPPYGMDAHKFSDGGGKLTGILHEYDDSYEAWQRLLATWAKLSFAVAKPEAHAYVFCDFDRFHELKGLMQEAGWNVFRTPIIIHKQNSGRVPDPTCGPRRQWEMVLYAIKGRKPVNSIVPDIISAPADESTGHGAQKPVAVYLDLLKRSVKPGDEVLDSFAGSGTIIDAAHMMKCKATAIEQDAGSFGLCLKRVQALKAQQELSL